MPHDRTQSDRSSGKYVGRGLGCVSLLITAVCLSAASAGAQEPAEQRTVKPETQSAVVFTNRSSDTVVIQIQPMVDGVCTEEHRAMVSRSIPPGGTWRMVSAQALCWRRESSDGAAEGRARTWSKAVPATGTAERVEVP